MDLAPAEELLDYQLAACPEEALWLDTTKIMRVTLSRTTDIKLPDSVATSVPKNRTRLASRKKISLCNVTVGEEQEDEGITWNIFTRGSSW